jgi:hypothetical protein
VTIVQAVIFGMILALTSSLTLLAFLIGEQASEGEPRLFALLEL